MESSWAGTNPDRKEEQSDVQPSSSHYSLCLEARYVTVSTSFCSFIKPVLYSWSLFYCTSVSWTPTVCRALFYVLEIHL